MPEQKSAKGSGGSGGKRLSARDAVQRVREELPELLGRPVESILGVKRSDNNGWEVTAAIVELARIPNSTDVLGAYRAVLDSSGELEGYERVRRYNRSQADED
jgi:hypothetical protein